MQSKAKTVSEYVKALPPERRKDIETIRKLIKKNLPKGLVEMMQYGMISYAVPLSTYPQGYRNQKDVPLTCLGLASQKNYMSLYLINIYGDKKAEKWFRESFKKAGKKLNMGRSCVRFRKVADLPLDLIGKVVGMTPVKKFIEMYEKSRR